MLVWGLAGFIVLLYCLVVIDVVLFRFVLLLAVYCLFNSFEGSDFSSGCLVDFVAWVA